MRVVACILLVLFLIMGCIDSGSSGDKSGRQLAESYCGSCHLFPQPGLLDKDGWKHKVLPPMATLLGIDHLYQLPLNKSDTNAIAAKDWQKIVDYYLAEAPDSMPAQGRMHVSVFNDRFVVQKLVLPENAYPATSFLKIDPGNNWLFAAGALDSSLTIYDAMMNPVSKNKVQGIVVDMDFKTLPGPGERSGVMTNIGIMNPNDFATGTIDRFNFSAGGKLTLQSRLFDHLPRPVETIPFPGKQGDQSFLVCGFGNETTGALMQLTKRDTGEVTRAVLRPLPGAIKAYVEDFSGDSKPDIMVLMAQADEGIFLLKSIDINLLNHLYTWNKKNI